MDKGNYLCFSLVADTCVYRVADGGDAMPNCATSATGSEEDQLAVYRPVRDAIRTRIEKEVLAPFVSFS